MPLPPLNNEKELLARIAAGDSTAFGELYNHYRHKVFFIAWRWLQNDKDAEDVVQEVFSKIWTAGRSLATIEHFNAWLNTITRNHLNNIFRKKAKEGAFILETVNNEEKQYDRTLEQIEFRDLQRLLRESVNQLPERQKKVFQLSRLEGCTHAEIAAILGISVETVKKHIMQATASLKAILVSKGHSEMIIFILLTLY